MRWSGCVSCNGR